MYEHNDRFLLSSNDENFLLSKQDKIHLEECRDSSIFWLRHMRTEFGIRKTPDLVVGIMVNKPTAESHAAGIFTYSADKTCGFIYISLAHLWTFPDRIITEVVPHEFAHYFHWLIDFQDFAKSNHDSLFPEIMEYMVGFHNKTFPIDVDSLADYKEAVKLAESTLPQ
jgi:hypothetical protein